MPIDPPTLELLWHEHSEGPDRLLGAVRIVAPAAAADGARAPVCVVGCIDVSGSMEGRKLTEAKVALECLVEQLAPTDTLGIVAFSDAALDLLPATLMDATGKALARQTIGQLAPMGSTNMAAGVRLALDFASSARAATNALRRVLCFTDGHANQGLPENDVRGWVRLVESARGQVGVSWFGFGEDHNADLLASLATRSGGQYVLAANEDAIRDAFATELGGLLSTVMTEVVVTLEPGPAIARLEVLNDVREAVAGGTREVRLDNVLAAESRHVVFEARLQQVRSAEALPPWLSARVGWRDPVTGERHSVTLHAETARKDREVVLEQALLLRAARAQAEAAERCAQGDFRGARALVLEAAERLAAVGTERARAVARVLERAAALYDESVYAESRAYLASVRSSSWTSRSSGTTLDELFETPSQRNMKLAFKRGPRSRRKN